MGYTPGGAYGRYTIADIPTSLFVSASTRMGGAIDSLVFNHAEYVNAWDHGRDLTVSIDIDSDEYPSPCFSANEAGAQSDAQSNKSTSVLFSISSDNNALETANQPAFWLSPGDGCAVNGRNVSMFNISKNVQIEFGYQGIWWIRYSLEVQLPMDVPHGLVVEAPVLFVNDFLDTFWWEDGDGGIYPVVVGNNTGGRYTSKGAFNLIAASSAADMAITLVPSNMPQQSLQFELVNYLGVQPETAATVKLAARQRYENVTAGDVLSLETFICVGTVMDVQFCEGFAH